MKKRAEEILQQQINTIVTTNDYAIAKQAFAKLTNLADVLDNLGEEKDADRIDEIIKEAASFWDFLLGMGGGALSTKDTAGGSILDALKSGNFGNFFNKETLVELITKMLVGGGIAVLANELVDVLTKKVPVLNWFGDSTWIKKAAEGALSYAVVNSNFVSHLVDGLLQQIESLLGWKVQQEAKQQPQQQPAQQPVQQQPQQQAGEGSSTQSFQVAPPAGAKQ